MWNLGQSHENSYFFNKPFPKPPGIALDSAPYYISKIDDLVKHMMMSIGWGALAKSNLTVGKGLKEKH